MSFFGNMPWCNQLQAVYFIAMSILDALLLGIIQGLTEFIPVSSSGHLVLMQEALNVSNAGLAFDVLLHIGTLAALLIYFHKDIVKLASGLFSKNEHTKLAWLIVLATIPAVIAGILVADYAETTFRSLYLVSFNLIFVGVLMILAEYIAERRKTSMRLEKIGRRQAVYIGLAQAAALLPGVSRSGATITAGIFTGIERVAATRFSFLLAIPAIAGATLKIIIDGSVQQSDIGNGVILAGIVTSFASGLFAIHFLIRFLSKHSLRIFAYYRIALGLLVVAVNL
jgi:undecaprenyl-diphosphatase